MAIDSKHPLYSERTQDWQQLRDVYAGERKVKERGVIYLPATSGMIDDGFETAESRGSKAYEAYRMRAVFPELFEDAVKSMLGAMHHKPPIIDLPDGMEDIREQATLQGESLQMLLQRINEAQIVTGRIGLMADLPQAMEIIGGDRVAQPVQGDERRDLPYIATYEAETIINWDAGTRFGLGKRFLNLVVLDESGYVRIDNFEWTTERSYRVLTYGDVLDNEGQTTNLPYRQGVFTGNNARFSETAMNEPNIMGQTLDEIPFVFINSSDVVPEPDKPPLLGLSNLILSIYRGEADYRQHLFTQGQDTLVLIGQGKDDENPVRTGAGAVIYVQNAEGDAKYIGVDSQGLQEQREALENQYRRAEKKAGSLLDDVSRQRESGDALEIRVAARTATLTEIVLAGAKGLQNILRIIARWRGQDPEAVIVTPNLDFIDDTISAQEVVQFTSAKNQGAPLSMESIHKYYQDRGLTEMSFEDEMARIMEERPLLEDGSTNDDGPEDDE